MILVSRGEMLLDPVEPFGDQSAEQSGLLVRQRMAGPVQHSEGLLAAPIWDFELTT
jgi:hypothetical protein